MAHDTNNAWYKNIHNDQFIQDAEFYRDEFYKKIKKNIEKQ